MSDYSVAVTFTIDADSQAEASELITRMLDIAFNEPEVLELHAQAPRWLPQKPAPFAERYPEAS